MARKSWEPMSNSEIAARQKAIEAARPKDNGQRTEVSGMRGLKRSHQLVWSKDGAELRDEARNAAVVYSGTYEDCIAEAKRRGLWYGE